MTYGLPSNHPYLTLANQLFRQAISETDLPHLVGPLPPLDRTLLQTIGDNATAVAQSQPRYGWALTAVADAAAQHTPDPFCQSLAAWYLAQAANAWYQPQRVTAASTRAQAGFAALGELGWVAACDWQLYAHPWMHNNFSQAAATLKQALHHLQVHNFPLWVPYCRLSLAYAHLLHRKWDQVLAQLELAQQEFQSQQDTLGLGHCHYTLSGSLRRQMRLPEARQAILQAKQAFATAGAQIEWLKANYSLAQIYIHQHQQLEEAEHLLQQAAQQFSQYDLPLWAAQSWYALANLYRRNGQIAQATTCLQETESKLENYPIWGLRADHAITQGQLALDKGTYTTALYYFRQAETFYQRLEVDYLIALAVMNQGETLGAQGFYQQSIEYLEKALAYYQAQKNNSQSAACHIRLANVWMQLGQLPSALSHLTQAAHYAHETQQKDWLSAIYHRQARLYLQQNQPDQAIAQIQKLLSLVAQHPYAQVDEATAYYLWGLAWAAQKQPSEAIACLRRAADLFAGQTMNIDLAYCFFHLGNAYAAQGGASAALAAWEMSLNLNENNAPSLMWQIQAEMGQCLREQAQAEKALEHYRQAVTALHQLRLTFWQPELADIYLEKPEKMLEQAISLAVTLGEWADILPFMEAGKAHTLRHRLHTAEQTQGMMPAAIQELAAQIQWWQKQVREQGPANKLAALSAVEIHEKLDTAVKQYSTAVAQWERSQHDTPLSLQPFDVAQFRQQANQALGSDWLALDYYLFQDGVACVVVTPTTQDVYVQKMSATIQMALHRVTQKASPKNQNQGQFRQHLTTLGNWLLPPVIHALEPMQTTVIIAPHSQLHQIPWSGLHVGQPARPLATVCATTLVPSLHTLTYLWQRVTPTPHRDWSTRGIILGVADFNGRHPHLPAVIPEVTALGQQFDRQTTLLLNEAATITNLRQLKKQGQLARGQFLHLASHILPDTRTGRLSQLALADGELWLDELRQLAPLPPLITLSACSGLRSRFYHGDEPLGLPVTCLAAGAQHVVGNLWPIQDKYSPEFMQEFYAHLGQGESVAKALAGAQQSSWLAQTDMRYWAGFQCLGMP